MSFNPQEHLTDIHDKDYLEVKWRLVWFREEHPTWPIITQITDRGDGWAIVKAAVKNDEGEIVATAHKSDTKNNFADYLEKAETGAIGRALAMIGYGTQFAPDIEEGERIADSPVKRSKKTKKQTKKKLGNFGTKVLKKGKCPIHNCETQLFQKGGPDGPKWWGHKKKDGDWCNVDPEKVKKAGAH